MAVRKPLVIVDGLLQELPTGDSISGATGGGSVTPDSILPMFTGTKAKSTLLNNSEWTLNRITPNVEKYANEAGFIKLFGNTDHAFCEGYRANPVAANADFDVVLKTFIYGQIDTYLCQGVYIGESATGKKACGCFFYTNNYGWQMWTNNAYNSEGANNPPTKFSFPVANFVYWRIKRVGDLVSFYVSDTGLGDALSSWEFVTSHSLSGRGMSGVGIIGVYSNSYAKSDLTIPSGTILLGFDTSVQTAETVGISRTHRKFFLENYTMIESDFFGGEIISNVGNKNVTVTIPAGLDARAPATFIAHDTNIITFAGAAGVTLLTMDGVLTLKKKNGVVTVIPIAPNTYQLCGNLT